MCNLNLKHTNKPKQKQISEDTPASKHKDSLQLVQFIGLFINVLRFFYTFWQLNPSRIEYSKKGKRRRNGILQIYYLWA